MAVALQIPGLTRYQLVKERGLQGPALVPQSCTIQGKFGAKRQSIDN